MYFELFNMPLFRACLTTDTTVLISVPVNNYFKI